MSSISSILPVLRRARASRRGARPVPRAGLVGLLTIALASLSVLGVVYGQESTLQGPPSALKLAGFYVALSIAALLNLEYYVRGEVDAIDQFEAALAPAIFFLPIAYVVIVAAAAKATSQALRGVHPVRAMFNVAQWSVAVTAGSLVFSALPVTNDSAHRQSQLGALIVASVVVAVVNALCLLAVFTLVQQGRLREWLPRLTASLLRDTSVGLFVNVAFGLLFVTTLAWEPLLSPLLLVPLALLHWASRGYAVGRVEQARLRVVQRATSALTAPALPNSGLTDFCTEVGHGFDREAVDLILTGSPAPAVFSWRRDPGSSLNAPSAEDVLATLGERGAPVRIDPTSDDPKLVALLARSGWRDCMISPLKVGDKGIGFLCLYGARSAVAFAEREQQVLVALAQEAGLAVENAKLVGRIVEDQQNLSQIVNGTQDGIATLGDEGRVTAWNPAFERMTGFGAEQVLGSPGLDILQPMDEHRLRVSLQYWAESSVELPTELLVRTSGGDTRWLSCSYARAHYGATRPRRLIITARDVTELKQAEAFLAGQTVVLALIAEGSPLAQTLGTLSANVAALTEEGRTAVMLRDPQNSDQLRLVASSGVGRETLRAVGVFQLTAPSSLAGAAVREQHLVSADDVKADPAWSSQPCPAGREDMGSCWVVPIQASKTESVLGVLVMLRPRPPAPAELAHWNAALERAARLAAIAITRTEFESQLAFQASHDALTGLPNRTVFLDRCEHALRRHRRTNGDVVIFFVDLDHFKLVNDSRGHDVGDKLLTTVAQRLSAAIRDSDTVARFGGDEFAILCEDLSDVASIREVARRVQLSLGAPVSLPGGDIFVRASMGVAVLTDDIDAATLISNADAAMYRAKRLGGNRCEFYEDLMRSRATVLLSLQSELQQGMERNQFFVDYQPLVSLARGNVTGAEALVRWRHPERGVLAPKDFLGLAESSGLIIPIGKQILDAACHQAKQWQDSLPCGRAIRVNINLSPLEFLQPDLVHTIGAVLETSGVDPALIGLEITESAIMEDIDATATTMHELKKLGVSLIIDDFGTGFSSLTHLKRFPVDELKVDRSFVAGLGSSSKDGAIVSAVIALAHSLDLTAVAEGVETVDQRRSLQDLGCDVGQGYYFGRPGPPTALI
jgi:diguanylate cyclase (GGDEF)-like protein/PAS domain S-box-containing protein